MSDIYGTPASDNCTPLPKNLRR